MLLNSENKINKELIPVMNDDNNLDYAIVCQSGKYGREYTNRIEIKFKDR